MANIQKLPPKPPRYGNFKTTNPHKVKETFNRYPEYLNDKKEENENDGDMREKILKRNKKEKIWIPNTFEWSKPCISIN